MARRWRPIGGAVTRAIPICRSCGVAAGWAWAGDECVCLACGHRERTLEPPAPRGERGRLMAHELPTRPRRPLLREGDISFKRTR